MKSKYEYMAWDENVNEVVITDLKKYDGKISSIKQLAVIMRQRQTIKGSGKSFYPTENQLKNSWDALRKESLILEKSYGDFRSIELFKGYKKRVVRDKKTGRFLKWIY